VKSIVVPENLDDLALLPRGYAGKIQTDLNEIEEKVPNHKTTDFKKIRWRPFKKVIWKAQNGKCAFCEKEIAEQESQLEHFRPKTEVTDFDHQLITREAYWWLAFNSRNYVVSCPTCNNQKLNRFPLQNEDHRITSKLNLLDNDGKLGNEIPLLINPRFERDFESEFEYTYIESPGGKAVKIIGNTERASGSIEILDLNRDNVNKKEFRDQLPSKRGKSIGLLETELSLINKHIEKFEDLTQGLGREDDEDYRFLILAFKKRLFQKLQLFYDAYLSKEAEFSGMNLWWINNKTEIAGFLTPERFEN
jgi:uncharacterized protein (TIGR02646 family)